MNKFCRLNSFDVNKGPGPDKIPSLLLRKCSSSLALPLHIVFNRSISSGRFPSFWKTSYIKPVLKSGSRADISNCRPISILGAKLKLFELLVYDNIKFKVAHKICSQ
ncbi:hypothetical protein WA026_006820 [Henosepilachna vigintioctopunctata]|uniref:RNA-directed DNA polymerase from mobile element jockey n=1 Tax=Henosepilachna vigintioctopunctata TaxID=420089 RepID=A0AAW1UAU0_9CUCU